MSRKRLHSRSHVGGSICCRRMSHIRHVNTHRKKCHLVSSSTYSFFYIPYFTSQTYSQARKKCLDVGNGNLWNFSRGLKILRRFVRLILRRTKETLFSY